MGLPPSFPRPHGDGQPSWVEEPSVFRYRTCPGGVRSEDVAMECRREAAQGVCALIEGPCWLFFVHRTPGNASFAPYPLENRAGEWAVVSLLIGLIRLLLPLFCGGDAGVSRRNS